MNLINILIYTYILLKPYYLSESGTLQLGDLFILVAFAITIYTNYKKKQKNEIEKNIEKNNIYLIVFILYISMVNLIYSLIYSESFLKPILYYIFNFMGIYVFTYRISDQHFLNMTKKMLIINIIIQLLIYILGIGRYYASTERYMGTFNDPNQFGFYIIMSMMLIYIIETIVHKKHKWYEYITFIISTYLILLSSSTGMILALVTFISLQLIIKILKVHKIKFNKKSLLIFSTVLTILMVVMFIKYNFEKSNINYENKLLNKIENLNIWNRLEEKIEKVNSNEKSILEDRHLDKVINYPYNLIYGAGEGKMERFGNNNGEIHSTFISIMFYYGLFPIIILLIWIYNNLKGLTFKQLIPYIAIFIESFTLINNRQLFFWVIIIMANLYKIKAQQN